MQRLWAHFVGGAPDDARFNMPVDLMLVRTLPTEIYDFVEIRKRANRDFFLLIVDQANQRIRKVTRGGSVETYSGYATSMTQRYDAPPPHCNEMTTTRYLKFGLTIRNVSTMNNSLCMVWEDAVSISSYRRWLPREQPMFQDGLRTLVFDNRKKELFELHQRQNIAFYVTGKSENVQVKAEQTFQSHTKLTVEVWFMPNTGIWPCASGYCSVWVQVCDLCVWI